MWNVWFKLEMQSVKCECKVKSVKCGVKRIVESVSVWSVDGGV